MTIVQYDLFKTREESEMDHLRLEMASVRESSNKVRRALFARHGELQKAVIELNDRLSVIERGICLLNKQGAI